MTPLPPQRTPGHGALLIAPGIFEADLPFFPEELQGPFSGRAETPDLKKYAREFLERTPFFRGISGAFGNSPGGMDLFGGSPERMKEKGAEGRGLL